LSDGASEEVPSIIANIMTKLQITLTVFIVSASLGLIIDQTSNRRRRVFVNNLGNRLQACCKNLRLMSEIKYKAGTDCPLLLSLPWVFLFRAFGMLWESLKENLRHIFRPERRCVGDLRTMFLVGMDCRACSFAEYGRLIA